MLLERRQSKPVNATEGMITARETRINGSGESISMMEPTSIDITPPKVSAPCDGIFTSSTNMTMARTISARPVRLTGSICNANIDITIAIKPMMPGKNVPGFWNSNMRPKTPISMSR